MLDLLTSLIMFKNNLKTQIVIQLIQKKKIMDKNQYRMTLLFFFYIESLFYDIFSLGK